jgi:hypothetical protein
MEGLAELYVFLQTAPFVKELLTYLVFGGVIPVIVGSAVMYVVTLARKKSTRV